MKLIENYVIQNGNIFFNGKLLSTFERQKLATNSDNSELLNVLAQDNNKSIQYLAFLNLMCKKLKENNEI